MKKFLMIVVTLTVCGFSVIAQSQSGGTISGKLLDKDQGEPVALANIRVLQRTRQCFVTGKATNNDAFFPSCSQWIIYIAYFPMRYPMYIEITGNLVRPIHVQLGDILLSNVIFSYQSDVSAKALKLQSKGYV